MPNQSERKCCHCGQKGHNSRTCTSKACGVGFKLFGVQIDVSAGDDGGGGGGGGGGAAAAASSSIRKSKSLGNLEACNPEGGGAAASEDSGYLSDGLIHQSSKSLDRKKGKPWSEEEHRSFLLGLEKLGKGDWKGIASKYVPSRKSSQVASHAQKYFIRKAGIEKRRRRTSVFDIPFTDSNQSSSQVIPGSQPDKAAVENSQPAAAVVASSSSKNMAEPNGQATNKQPLPPHAATSERPPLSPMKTHGFVDFRGTFYKPYWVPVVNFPSQNSSGVFVPNMHGALAACTAFVPQQHSVAAWRQPLGQQSFSQAGSAAPIPNNDELNLNIRKLALQ